MMKYLPEGRLIHTPENHLYTADLAALAQAMKEKRTLEGIALRCNPDGTLIVSLGTFEGIIPRAETALGIEEGLTRDIAVISRVGKPVCFQITAIEPNLVLSRRKAQLEALTGLTNDLVPGDVRPATVINLERYGAFVDLARGIPALIPTMDISISRIPHPAERFCTGQEIYCVIKSIDRELSRFTLSHKELLGTWAENAATFEAGETVQGIVSGVMPYGLFVSLSPNLSGLAEPFPGCEEGDRVSVYIKSILPDKSKIKLHIIDKLKKGDVLPLRYYIKEGRLLCWKYHEKKEESDFTLPV